jgi:glycosyltransferase involved in cell wall biosynthesis
MTDLPRPVDSRGREGARPIEGRLRNLTIQFGISSYNEGHGIVATLESIFQGARICGIRTPSFVLSDSSDTGETVSAAETWANTKSVSLVVDRSERRRSKKQAVNTIFERADSDLLVLVDADIVVLAEGLAALLTDLTSVPPPVMAFGAVVPDPSKRAIKYRASAWQMRAVHQLNSHLPSDAVRTEGAFWGAWRSFYKHYRFPLGRGSIYEDLELAEHIRDNRIGVRNSWRAVAYKVPAGSLRDFYLQTYRYYAAARESPRRARRDLLFAAAAQARRDPVGAVLYVCARFWATLYHRRRPVKFEEQWDAAASTKR